MKDAKDLFIGVYPTGLTYADRSVLRNGDYKPLAFLSFSTLELRFEKDCPAYWKPIIQAHAANLKPGQEYQVSASGQTVVLGDAL